jgi:hypothetical protein
MSRRSQASILAALEHPRRRVDADSLARHPRHDYRDAPPMRRDRLA